MTANDRRTSFRRDRPSSRLTRRTLLTGAGALGALTGFSACDGSNSSNEHPTATPAPTATAAIPTPTQGPISSPVPGYLDPTRWEGRTITVASAAAGDYLDALSEAYFDAFAMATGAKVRHTDFGRDGINGMGNQVKSGEIIWDVVLMPTENALPLAQKGYLTTIDYNVVDKTDLYPEIALQQSVGQAIYSTAVVYAESEPRPPSGWGDFWNLSLFGGKRALRKDPVGTLEFSLLADGVASHDLYPLDVPRAFASLDRIREATVFYEDSKQPVELVHSGQVGLASAWSVRTDLKDVDSVVKTQWNGGMLCADSWGIPKGSANTDIAMSFINFATRAVPAASFTRLQPFGPVNKNAFALLRDDIVATLPNAPANISGQFFQNWSYWAELQDELTAQFNDWYLHPPGTPTAAPSATPGQ